MLKQVQHDGSVATNKEKYIIQMSFEKFIKV